MRRLQAPREPLSAQSLAHGGNRTDAAELTDRQHLARKFITMLQLVISDSQALPTTGPDAEYGIWTGYRIPDDRSSWHPLVRDFCEHCIRVAPAGKLPGRQHIHPEEIPA